MLEKYFTEEEIEYLKKCEDLELKCKYLVVKLFKGRTDKAGKPYIGHLIRVSNRLKNEDERCAALLHDTLEDIEGMTPEILLDLNIPKNIIDMVVLVTKEEGLSYEEEINKIIKSGNDGALRIKYSDMLDNSDPERLNKLDKETREKLNNKYSPQLKKLCFELRKRGNNKEKF